MRRVGLATVLSGISGLVSYVGAMAYKFYNFTKYICM
jgi:hypothetical protein